MAAKNGFRTEDKLMAVESLIAALRAPVEDQPGVMRECVARNADLLHAVASDLRARLNGVPSAALTVLSGRVAGAHRGFSGGEYPPGQMIGIAQEIVGRWPVVRQALELFGALIESGEPPTKAAFDLGFEHAIAGGDEMAKKAGIQGHLLPIVMYFATEEDRREMIDAVTLAKPGLVKMKIPERSKA